MAKHSLPEFLTAYIIDLTKTTIIFFLWFLEANASIA